MSTDARQWRIFYAYTLWSVLSVFPLIPLLLLLLGGTPALREVGAHPVSTLLLALQIVIAAAATRAALSRWAARPASPERGRWDLPRVGTLTGSRGLLGLAAAPTLLLAASVLLRAGSGLVLVLSAAVLAATVLIRLPWIWTLVAALAAAILALPGLLPPAVLPVIVVVLLFVPTARMSIWLGAVVRELELARETQGQLAVAEERLRFARDLHDVTGRDLSVIAVKAELVAQLAERGDPRAAEHGRDVAQIARSSLAEIRALVRGYREADLAAELRGTASLLRSAHAQVTIDGSADAIPPQHREAAAWVLREGGTNILRHADPTAVQIALTAQGITMTNDGVPGSPDGSAHSAAVPPADSVAGSAAPTGPAVQEGIGLAGMRERLGPRAHLETLREDDRFTLAVRFDPAGGPA